MPFRHQQASVVAEVQQCGELVQLIEVFPGTYLLRRVKDGGRKISETAPLFKEPAALAEARELFPEHLPWMGMPVDGR